MADPASWDLLDEDCSDISDWADMDLDTAVSEVDPAGQFRLDTNLGAAGNALARRQRMLASAPNVYTLEVKLYHDDIGLLGLNNYFTVGNKQTDRRFVARFASNGLLILDTSSGDTVVGADLVKEAASAEWQTWRFLVTFIATLSDGTCDVYLTDSTHTKEKVGTAIPCSKEAAGTDKEVELIQRGSTSDNMVTHIDYIKIASGLYAPVGPVNLKSVNSVISANIKSINGISFENVKSISGII